jgi:hypothetical protein
MTPKEKAKELVNKFQKQIFFDVTDNRLDIDEAKGCALIAVDEIIKSQKCCDECQMEGSIEMAYWQQVKQEIEKL